MDWRAFWRTFWHQLWHFDFAPTHWGLAVIKVAGRAWHRTQKRGAALYLGGVCFYAMLAAFPALVILIGLYSMLFTPDQAANQAAAFAHLLPPGAQGMFESQLTRLAHAPMRIVSVQSGLAVLIAFYASHRGVKALMHGLNFIHDEQRPRGFVGFNVLALFVALAGFALVSLISAIFLSVRVMAETLQLTPFGKLNWVFSEWTWASIGLILGMTLVYRFAMSSRPVVWLASALGGFTAAVLSMFASWGCAYYVEQIAHLGATYGSITAVVVFLIWLSWNVNAIFYGGALATEVEIILGKRDLKLLEDHRPARPPIKPPQGTPAPPRRRAARRA